MAEPSDPAAVQQRDLLHPEDALHTAQDTILPANHQVQEAEAVRCQDPGLPEALAITTTRGTTEAVQAVSTAVRALPRRGAVPTALLQAAPAPAVRARPGAVLTALLQAAPIPAVTAVVADTAAVVTAVEDLVAVAADTAAEVTVGEAAPVAAAEGNIIKSLNHEKNGYYYRLDGNLREPECSGRSIPCLYV